MARTGRYEEEAPLKAGAGAAPNGHFFIFYFFKIILYMLSGTGRS
jgi:hypothetical protein